MLMYFSVHVTFTQTSTLLSLPRQNVSDFFHFIRYAMYHYMETHLIYFTDGLVLEADEMYLSRVNTYDNESHSIPAHWIIGVVELKTSKVYLEAAKNRTTRTMSRIFNSVVPFPSIIITDKWTSYNFLDDNHEHLQCEKHMAFSHSIEYPYDHIRFCGEKISVNTNTIEGF